MTDFGYLQDLTVGFQSFDELVEEWRPLFESISQQIEQQGYYVNPQGLPASVVTELANKLYRLPESEFSLAAVGRGQTRQVTTQWRSNKIVWINDDDPYNPLWSWFTRALQAYLNRRLFLGLFSFESHFACYQPGDFYRTHLDALSGQSNRILSLVTYLNADWLADDGGELQIFDPHSGSLLHRVAPEQGTLVLFLSEDFPHEVLPAKRVRYSIAGWFRLNSSSEGRVDPPR